MIPPSLPKCAYFRLGHYSYTIRPKCPSQEEEKMILITGASGTVGKAVLAEVARSGLNHRAMYRSKEDAANAPAGTKTVIADFSDKASLGPALRGVESVYLVCSPIPALVQLEGN